MKLTVLQKEFAPALSIVSRFVSPRAQLPILSNIKLVSKGNKLIMLATNLEMSICLKVGAKVEEEGEITTPARVMSELISSIKSEQVNIYVEGETIKISTDTMKTSISGTNTSDFPEIMQEPQGKEVNVSSEDLSQALPQVLFSTSPDDTRPALAGVLVEFEDEVALVSSDGFRLSRKVLNVDKPVISENIILPKSASQELSKLLGSNNDNLKLFYDSEENLVSFETEKGLVTSRIIQGEYQPYKKIIPSSHKISVSVSKQDLISAIKLASVIARDGANIINLNIGPEGFKLITENDKGGMQESIVPAKIEGGGLEIRYNYKYIEEFLNAISGDDVIIELNDTESPGVFRDKADKNYLHLIMPIKS